MLKISIPWITSMTAGISTIHYCKLYQNVFLTNSINEHIRGIEVQVDEGEPKVHLDERCRCVCPAFDVPNVARMSGQVYTGQVDNAQDCSCANIVLPSIPDLQKANYGLVESQACPLCQCSYQRRNLTIIYLCVVFILVIISGFALYLLLSQVIWPKIGVSFSYKQQHDDEHLAMEEVNEDSSGQVKSSDFDSYSATASSSRFSWVNSLSRQQQKWRQDLHRQQKNIYQDHAMLN